MKWLGYLFLLVLVAIIALPFLAVESDRLVPVVSNVSAEEANTAKDITSQIKSSLSASSQSRSLTLTNDELTTAFKVASYSVAMLDVESRLSSFGLTLVATIPLEKFGYRRYVNVMCVITNGYQGVEFESCRLGKISLPGSFVVTAIELALQRFVGEHSLQLWQQIKTNTRFERNQLIVSNIEPSLFAPSLQASFSEAQNLVGGNGVADKALINQYIQHLADQQTVSSSLILPIKHAFVAVAEQTLSGTTNQRLEHIRAALWALIIRYGNPKFARLVGIHEPIQRGTSKTLQGREDLALHFLYSAALQLTSGTNTAFSIGELKELLDTNRGGSGFSFADVVADKAGLTFAEHVTNSNNDLQIASLTLAQLNSEESIMLDISKRPEGISEQEFKAKYRSISSPEYRQVIAEIGDEISQLPLYRAGRG